MPGKRKGCGRFGKSDKKGQTLRLPFLCLINNNAYSLWGVFVFIFNKETKTTNKTLTNNKLFMTDPP